MIIVSEEEEARERAEAERRREQTEARQKVKAELKRNRQRIRTMCSPLVEDGQLDAQEVQDICLGTPADQLDVLATEFEKLAAEEGGLVKVLERLKELTEMAQQLEREKEKQHKQDIEKHKVRLQIYS